MKTKKEIAVKTHFITDSIGNKIGVVLSIKEYERILDELEELEDIRLYDKVKSGKEISIPVEEAFKMLDAKRKRKLRATK